MKQIVQRFALVVGGIFIALALCEGLIWLAPQKLLPARLQEVTKRLALYRSSEGMFVGDSELLFKIRPNYDAIVDHPDYHVQVTTRLNLDGVGFRGGILGGPPWAVAVGDSFTFGVGVEHEATWAARLARALGREVINLGIPAQGPPQYTRVLKRYGLQMRPKVAFYGFYFNDLDATNRFYRMKRNLLPLGRYLRQYSALYNLVTESRASRAAAQPVRGAVPSPSGAATAPNRPAAEAVNDAGELKNILQRQKRNFEQRWRLTVKELDDALKASQDAGVELIMLYMPSRWEIRWESIKAQERLADSLDIDRRRRALGEYCEARKIACIDLTTALMQEARQGKELYFPSDGHWNKEGNRIVAEALKNYLTEKGLSG